MIMKNVALIAAAIASWVLGAAVLLTPEAGAVNPRVRSACANDFMAHCSQHEPDSAGARSCMRAHGSSLSKACLDALVAAGEVSRQEVARRERRK
jgi:hypothetical protein